jgi:hypothetical protein
MYLFEVKKLEESKGPWDYYKQLATIPAEEAWRPLDQGTASDPLDSFSFSVLDWRTQRIASSAYCRN